MGEVWFYHLTETPLEAALPPMLIRSRAQGWRVEVRGRDPGRMAALDAALWLGPEEGFLPHGLQGGPHDAAQPVLLTTQAAGAGFACVMAVDGALLEAGELAGLARACVLFDGNDTDATAAARDQWRVLTGEGVGAKYWAQEDGRWVMKSEKAGA
jgi:DNA polymerase-3 subunit chi